MEQVSEDITAGTNVSLDEDGFPVVFQPNQDFSVVFQPSQHKRAWSSSLSSPTASVASLVSTVQYEDTPNNDFHQTAIDDAGFPIFEASEPVTPALKLAQKAITGLTPEAKGSAVVDTNSRRHKVDLSKLAVSFFH